MRRTLYDDDHEAFRESVRGFVGRFVTPHQQEHLAAHGLPRELWRQAGEQGLLGLQVPEEFGGSGAGDYRFMAVLMEELSAVAAAYSSCVGIHADVVAPYLVELGTEDQKARWLPGVSTGEIVLAIGMTESSGGSDLAALRTSAVREDGGWLINGSKTFITNGYSADLIVVAARTSPEKKSRGITLFGVEATAPGFSRGRKLDKVGQDESDTAELFFQDLRVTDAEVIGEVDRGFAHMMQRLPRERLGASICNIAHAKQILLETVEYVQHRRAFGAPIGSFQHNKFLIAELATQIDVAQAYLDQCVVAYDAGDLTGADAAKAKWWSSEVQNSVLDHCVQLYGGYGYMNEYRVSRAWRDARVTRIWAGSNEIMKELIGRDLGL